MEKIMRNAQVFGNIENIRDKKYQEYKKIFFVRIYEKIIKEKKT